LPRGEEARTTEADDIQKVVEEFKQPATKLYAARRS
jgi:hypothetical protein